MIDMDFKNKEVGVIDENGVLTNVKQYCKELSDKNLVLLSNTEYDNTNKIYHKFYDCYEDWPYNSQEEFDKWRIEQKDNLNEYKECARCMERKYRLDHPNATVTGYGFHYYFEDI